MTRQLKQIIGHIFNKKYIKWWMFVILVLCIFVWNTYAADVEPSAKNSLVELFYDAFSFLSRWWIIFANLAWKMMTNDIVYGTFLHLDNTLWTFWNVMKNIANILLGFFVIYAVLRNVLSAVWQWDDKRKPLDVIKKTLIAWILIQMSRFLTAATIDLSSVCVAAVWSFPAQFLTVNDEFKWTFKNNLTSIVHKKVVVDYGNPSSPITTESVWSGTISEDETNSLIDTVLPNTDSLSGPLIYIWMSIFNLRDFNRQEVQEDESWWQFFLTVWLDGILVLSYSIMMILIFIFNFMRVLLLWLIIPMMPLIILANVFSLTDKLKDIKDLISIKNIATLIFKPVLLVWALSLVLIILILIKWIINSNANKVDLSDKNLIITSTKNADNTYNSSMDVDWLVNVDMNWFKDWFADIVVYILWICLIYFVLKLSAIKTWIKFIDEPLDKLFNNMTKLMTNAPIIPIPWWATSISSIQSRTSRDDLFSRAAWINTTDQEDRIARMIWIETDSYDMLSPWLTKREFIQKAKKASERYGIHSYDDMKQQKNNRYRNDLESKITERSKANNNVSLPMEDIFAEDKKQSTKTTTTQTTQPTQEPKATTPSTGTATSQQ